MNQRSSARVAFVVTAITVTLLSGCDWLKSKAKQLKGDAPPKKLELRTSEARSELGTNLGALGYPTGVNPFNDVMRSAEPWHSGAPEHPDPNKRWNDGRDLDVDAKGWVKKLEPGQVARTFVFGSGVPQPSGKVTVLYEGEGTLQYKGLVSKLERTPGKDTFVLDSKHGLFLELTEVNPEDHMRNVRMYVDSLGGPDDGLFTKQFLASIEGFSVLRAMDWTATNRIAGLEGEDAPFKQWLDYPQRSDRSWVPVPYEIVAELGNAAGADIWLTVPHTASDQFVRKMAQAVHDTLDAERKVYVEYSNETWNAMFGQTYYVGAMGCQMFAEDAAQECTTAGTEGLCLYADQGLSVPCYLYGRKYHAVRTAQVMVIWEKVFEDRPGKLRRVLGGRTGDMHDAGKTMLNFPWDGKEPTHEHVDYFAIAPYFHGDPSKSVDRAFEKAPKGTNGVPMSTYYALTGWPAPHGGLYGWILSDVEELQKFPDVKLIAYEGGQHFVGHTEEAQERVYAINEDPRMKPLYLAYLDMWANLTDGALFVHYTSPTVWTKFGAWGSKRYPGQPRAEAPKHDALLTYIEKTGAKTGKPPAGVKAKAAGAAEPVAEPAPAEQDAPAQDEAAE